MKHSEIKAWVAAQDWSLGCKAIAEANGINYDTVRQRAKKHNITNAPAISERIKQWAAEQEWDKGYAHVAEASGLSYFVVAARAKKFGIKATLMKRGRPLGSKNPACRKIPEDVQIDFTQSDAHLAKQFRVSREIIRQLRKAAGVAPFPRSHKKP